ncbi:hypothetical protein HK099_008324 [Clydaea vesicula]|uniref:PAS domain-containing protein n=1 Tax=Clydaea vesicula TaxID=447962 RepID=A0AAD5Y3L5_9FUNG|nr:hypothetical protein HK099_008324 [Clydaea vesicula]
MERSNEWHAGIVAVQWWICLCCLISIQVYSSPGYGEAVPERALDFILMFGTVPSFLSGKYIIGLRYQQLEIDTNNEYLAITERCVLELKESPKLKMLSRKASVSRGYVKPRKSILNKEKDELSSLECGVQEDFASMLPKSIKVLSKILIELTGRKLSCDPTDSDRIATAHNFYKFAELDISFIVRYGIFVSMMVVKKNEAMRKTKGNEELNLMGYIEFQKFLIEAKIYTELTVKSIHRFWSLLLSPSITLDSFNDASKNIECYATKAQEIFLDAISKYPKAHKILESYGKFIDICLNDSDEAEKCRHKAQELRIFEQGLTGESGESEMLNSDNALLTVNREGWIERVNKQCLKLFGYSENEMVGRHLNIVIPRPWREFHSRFMNAEAQDNLSPKDSMVIGKPREVYALHKLGYAFEINIEIGENYNEEKGCKVFVAMITEKSQPEDVYTLISNPKNDVMLINKAIIEFFGYTSLDLVGKSVKLLFPETHKDAFIKSLTQYQDDYLNFDINLDYRKPFPIQKKNGEICPMIITFNDFALNGELYLKIRMTDVSKFRAEIITDGFGLIQSCNSNFSLVYGYDLTSVIGKSINILMNPETAEVHDFYFQKYRSMSGCEPLYGKQIVVNTFHADGSLIKAKLSIVRTDDLTSNESSTMRFKGFLCQCLESEKINYPRQLFSGANAVQFNDEFSINKVERRLLTELGYSPADWKKIKGCKMEILIPSVVDINKGLIKNSVEFQNVLFMAKLLSATGELIPNCIYFETVNHCATMYTYNLTGHSTLVKINRSGKIKYVGINGEVLFGQKPSELLGVNIQEILKEDPSNLIPADTKYSGTGLFKDGLGKYIEFPVEYEIGTDMEDNICCKIKYISTGETMSSETFNKLQEEANCKKKDIQPEKIVRNKPALKFASDNESQILSMIATDANTKIDFPSQAKCPIMQAMGSKNGITSASFENHLPLKEPSSSVKTPVRDMGKDELRKHSSQLSLVSAVSGVSGHSGVSGVSSVVEEKLADIRRGKQRNPIIQSLVKRIYFGLFMCILCVFACIANILIVTANKEELINSLYEAKVMESSYNRIMALSRDLVFITTPNATTTNCSWLDSSNYTDKCNMLKTCDVPLKDMIRINLITETEQLTTNLKLFQKNYDSYREVGSDLDIFLSSQVTLRILYSASDASVTYTASSFWDVWNQFDINSNALIKYMNVTTTRHQWAFIIINREVFANLFNNLQRYIIDTITADTKYRNNLIIIMPAALLIVLLLIFHAIIYPAIVKFNKKRLVLLQTVLSIPKSSICEMIVKQYSLDEDEEEPSQDHFADEVKKINKLKKNASENTVIVIPTTIQALWINLTSSNIDFVYDSVGEMLYINSEIQTVKWNLQSLIDNNCENSQFCVPFSESRNTLNRSITEIQETFHQFVQAQNNDPEISSLLYKNFCYSDNPAFCNASLTDPRIRHHLGVPSDFVQKTTRGISTLFYNIILASYRILMQSGLGYVDMDLYWFSSQAIDYEVSYATDAMLGYYFSTAIRRIKTLRYTGLAVYSATLVYILFLYFYAFASLKRNLQQLSNHSNNGIIFFFNFIHIIYRTSLLVLFMLPRNLISKNRKIRDYINNIYADLSQR